MDPNANLKQQRELAKRILEIADADAGERRPTAMLEIETHAEELAELVIALDEWRLKGGFDPYSPGR